MIVNYTSDNGWSTFLDNFKSQVPIITEEFNNAKSAIESLGENQPENWLKWAESMDYTDGMLLNFLSDVDSGKRSINDIGNYLESAAKSTSTFSNITKTAGSALKTLGAFTINMVATMAIEKVFELGAK